MNERFEMDIYQTVSFYTDVKFFNNVVFRNAESDKYLMAPQM